MKQEAKFSRQGRYKLDAILRYDNGINQQKISITETLENTTTIIGTDGALKILDPWLPKKKYNSNRKKGKIKEYK